MKDDFRHDNRYNYEQLMNKIKYENKNIKSSSSNRYRLKYNYSNEIIFKNQKISSKVNKLFI